MNFVLQLPCQPARQNELARMELAVAPAGCLISAVGLENAIECAAGLSRVSTRQEQRKLAHQQSH